METQVKALTILLSALEAFCFVCANSAFLNKSQHFTVHLFRPWRPGSARGSDGGPRRFTEVIPTPHVYSGQWPVKTKRARARSCASVITRKRPSLNRADGVIGGANEADFRSKPKRRATRPFSVAAASQRSRSHQGPRVRKWGSGRDPARESPATGHSRNRSGLAGGFWECRAEMTARPAVSVTLNHGFPRSRAARSVSRLARPVQ